MLRFKVTCVTHNKVVQPAGLEFHFMPYDEHMTPLAKGFFELDLTDTWCPVSDEKDHEYRIQIVANNKLDYVSAVGTTR